jgi:dihydropteroate synthase
MKTFWQTSRFLIDLSRPVVMGIVNATPDSFSDGGHYFAESDPSRVLAHCDLLLKEGADMLDIGGESTRPGSPPLPLAQELARVMPVLRHAVSLGVPVSVDTYKPEVMQAALDLGFAPPRGAASGGGASTLRGLPDAHAPGSANHAGRANGGQRFAGSAEFFAIGCPEPAGRGCGTLACGGGPGYRLW